VVRQAFNCAENKQRNEAMTFHYANGVVFDVPSDQLPSHDWKPVDSDDEKPELDFTCSRPPKLILPKWGKVSARATLDRAATRGRERRRKRTTNAAASFLTNQVQLRIVGLDLISRIGPCSSCMSSKM
jgi:hypothetical protein